MGMTSIVGPEVTGRVTTSSEHLPSLDGLISAGCDITIAGRINLIVVRDECHEQRLAEQDKQARRQRAADELHKICGRPPYLHLRFRHMRADYAAKVLAAAYPPEQFPGVRFYNDVSELEVVAQGEQVVLNDIKALAAEMDKPAH